MAERFFTDRLWQNYENDRLWLNSSKIPKGKNYIKKNDLIDK